MHVEDASKLPPEQSTKENTAAFPLMRYMKLAALAKARTCVVKSKIQVRCAVLCCDVT